ncbi:MAG TPA: hypothetical protein VGG64_19545, partial [Pirellulales bacterium]
MTARAKSRISPKPSNGPSGPTVEAVLQALGRCTALSPTRRRDLRSAVLRVAQLLGAEPAAIPLSLEKIQAGLAAINPVAAGVTPKRFVNIRSDFLAAVRASGVLPIKLQAKAALDPAWSNLLSSLSKGHHLGLMRLARYLSNEGIRSEEINDRAIGEFILAVRQGSLHKRPNVLHKQVTRIWNEVATLRGLPEVTVPSFQRTAKRIKESLLPRSFIQDRDDYLAWCSVGDPFAVDARNKPLAPRTLKLARDQIRAAVSALVRSGEKLERVRSLADLVTV